jgi:hypothetical protein
MAVRIELHIEELVLHGARAADRHDVAGALERGLVRLFSDPTVTDGFTTSRSVPVVEGAPLSPRSKATPASLGTAVAHSVVEGIRR